MNPCSAEEFATQLRQFITGYFAGRLAPGQRWGFKEILYNAPAVLVALARLFPQGRFIFVKRDRLEVTRSKVHAFVKESNWERFPPAEQTRRIRRMLGEIDTQYRGYDEFLEKRPAAGLIVEYERLVSAPQEVTREMLAHLGLDEGRYDWSLAQQVMQRNVAATPPDEMLMLLVREIATLMADGTGMTDAPRRASVSGFAVIVSGARSAICTPRCASAFAPRTSSSCSTKRSSTSASRRSSTRWLSIVQRSRRARCSPIIRASAGCAATIFTTRCARRSRPTTTG